MPKTNSNRRRTRRGHRKSVRKAVGKQLPPLAPIDPEKIYRTTAARHYFPWGPTVYFEKVRSGEVRTMALSDSGKATGMIGQWILDWREARIAKAAERRLEQAS